MLRNTVLCGLGGSVLYQSSVPNVLVKQSYYLGTEHCNLSHHISRTNTEVKKSDWKSAFKFCAKLQYQLYYIRFFHDHCVHGCVHACGRQKEKETRRIVGIKYYKSQTMDDNMVESKAVHTGGKIVLQMRASKYVQVSGARLICKCFTGIRNSDHCFGKTEGKLPKHT